MLYMHFEITECAEGKTPATPDNVARVIDFYTRSFQVRPTLKAVLEPLDTRSLFDMDINAVHEALASIEQLDERLPHFEDEHAHLIEAETGDYRPMTTEQRLRIESQAAAHEISAPAMLATKELIRRFDFCERESGRVKCTEKNIAILVDVSTAIHRISFAIAQVMHETKGKSPEQIAASMREVRIVLDNLKMALTKMPAGTATLNKGKDFGKVDIGVGVSYDQRMNRLKVTRALNNSKSDKEQMAILVAASKDKLL